MGRTYTANQKTEGGKWKRQIEKMNGCIYALGVLFLFFVFGFFYLFSFIYVFLDTKQNLTIYKL